MFEHDLIFHPFYIIDKRERSKITSGAQTILGINELLSNKDSAPEITQSPFFRGIESLLRTHELNQDQIPPPAGSSGQPGCECLAARNSLLLYLEREK